MLDFRARYIFFVEFQQKVSGNIVLKQMLDFRARYHLLVEFQQKVSGNKHCCKQMLDFNRIEITNNQFVFNSLKAILTTNFTTSL